MGQCGADWSQSDEWGVWLRIEWEEKTVDEWPGTGSGRQGGLHVYQYRRL